MAARFEPPEAEADLHHLALERVDDAPRHAKGTIDVELGAPDDGRPAELPEQGGRGEHEREDVNHHNHVDEHSEKPEPLSVPADATVSAVDDIAEPTAEHGDPSAPESVTQGQDITGEQEQPEGPQEEQPPHHAVLPDHTTLAASVESALAQAAVPTAHPSHLTVIMPPPQQPAGAAPATHPPEPQQPVKKKRKTYSNDEERRKARILKNRRTAEESRQRRMKKMKELEEYVAGAALREKELQEEARVAKVQVQALTESMEQMANEKNALIAQKDAEIQRLRERLQMK